MAERDSNEAAFKEAYASLNAAQREAVDTIEGPVMVVAGPGTGKTQILTLRIANILLKTDVQPENILALTFTESGAKAMRERLRRYVGAAAYRVPIFTFHGFAGRLIAEYPDAYARVVGGRPANDVEKIRFIETILESDEVRLLRPIGNPSYYVTPILRILSELKRENVTPDTLATIVSEQEKQLAGTLRLHEKGAHKGKVRGEYTKLEKIIEKNKELLVVYRQYEALLVEAKLFDFDDMILDTIAALESDENMLRDIQETYQYVLADEHQDVNGAQNRILELIASFHDSPNIFAVGDEKQAIYRFQGASLENFLYFEDKFPGGTTIALTENYRSGQSILDAAHSLVAVEDGPLQNLRVPLTAAAVIEAEITRRDFSHQAVEDDWMVDTIKTAIKAGTNPAEIAVILRTNREVEAIAAALRAAGVPATASADGDILRHPLTETVRALIAATTNVSESALFSVLHGNYWGLSAADRVRIMGARRYDRSLSTILADEELLQELEVSDPARAHTIHTVLERARDRQTIEPPHRVLEGLIVDSGLLDHVMKVDPIEGGRVIRRLYDEIESLVQQDATRTLADVVTHLQIVEAHGLSLVSPYIGVDASSVSVMTAHKSKGLEFEVVFVPHLIDSAWGGSSKRTYFTVPYTKNTPDESAVLDDERRLLYVAMTRAKQVSYLSSAEQNSDGKPLTPTRLFEDIEENLLPAESTEAVESSFTPVAVFGSSGEQSLDGAFLMNIVSERGFSATSLNNYLRSPWDYFYRNVLRIPEVQTLPLLYGTAVHSVMEQVTRTFTSTASVPSDTVIRTLLESALSRLPINESEFTQLFEKGLDALMVYIPHMQQSLTKESRSEFSIKVALPTDITELPELPLTGNLDRLDFSEDGNVLRVTDYKTGKPKTRNDIEGKTKTSDGGYKRQLTFYALLLSLYDDERYACRTGVLSFVEPDSKGVIREELFEITDDEIEELKQEIIDSTREIIAGDFLKSLPEEGESDYWQLAHQLMTK